MDVTGIMPERDSFIKPLLMIRKDDRYLLEQTTMNTI
jgi:hypothetical protein